MTIPAKPGSDPGLFSTLEALQPRDAGLPFSGIMRIEFKCAVLEFEDIHVVAGNVGCAVEGIGRLQCAIASCISHERSRSVHQVLGDCLGVAISFEAYWRCGAADRKRYRGIYGFEIGTDEVCAECLSAHNGAAAVRVGKIVKNSRRDQRAIRRRGRNDRFLKVGLAVAHPGPDVRGHFGLGRGGQWW